MKIQKNEYALIHVRRAYSEHFKRIEDVFSTYENALKGIFSVCEDFNNSMFCVNVERELLMSMYGKLPCYPCGGDSNAPTEFNGSDGDKEAFADYLVKLAEIARKHGNAPYYYDEMSGNRKPVMFYGDDIVSHDVDLFYILTYDECKEEGLVEEEVNVEEN